MGVAATYSRKKTDWIEITTTKKRRGKGKERVMQSVAEK